MQEHRILRPAHACFSRPHISGGPPLSSVYTLFQDSTGFVWVGMQHGLARLDAHNARRFTHDAGDAGSIPGKFIIALGEDDRENIWVGAYDGGCARYDPRSERFTPVDLRPIDGNDRVVRCFHFMSDGRMWIGTNGSLTAIDPATGRIRKFRHPVVDDPCITGVNRFPVLHPLDDRRLLAGTASGAFIVDIVKESFHYIPFNDRGLPEKTRHGIVDIARSGESIIVATTHQIYRLDDERRSLEIIEPLANPPAGAIDRKLTSLAADPRGEELWIGTVDGLLRFGLNDRCYSLYQRDDTDERSLCGSGIAALHRDRSGMLWIGTANGVSLLDHRRNFHYHRLRAPGESRRVKVQGFAEGSDGAIWIGTPNGLYEFDPRTHATRRHTLGGDDPEVERINNQILQIHQGRRFLWIGAVNGLFQYDMEERRVVRHYEVDAAAGTPGRMHYLMGLHVQGVLEDDEGFVWSGSDAMGLQRLDPRTGEFHYYSNYRPMHGTAPHDTLLDSLRDGRGRLWFGFVTCLARYDPSGDTFETFVHDAADPHSISNNMITAIHEDARGALWVGTASGLNRVVERADGSPGFVRYGIQDGLPSDFIVSIVEHDEELWLGVDGGVVRFSERGGSVEARLYNASDGLHSDQYIHRAAYRDRNGWLYLGGGDGFDRFNPRHIRSDITPPDVVLTGLRLFNRPVPIAARRERNGNGAFVLERSITHLRDLTLSHRQSVITFSYAALHYLQPEKIRYAYMLEGFDGDWIDAGGKTEATYTNLDPGSYTFRVRATNSDGVRGNRDVALAIRVQPPPWRTWWAHSLYGLAGSGAIALYTRWRIERRERELRELRQIEKAREEERESIRRQNASDFHDEAGTTLTRILFLTELARRQGGEDEELRALLEKIDDNATHLSQRMRDFIWVLDPDRDTLLDTIQRIETVGQSLLGASDTAFTMQYDHQRLRDITLGLNERRQLLMISTEAIHNAARHAGAGSVVVRADSEGGEIIIAIEDDGRGFRSGEGNGGYGMKSMRGRAESIGAVLKIESEPGEGTRVAVRITRNGAG